jgi:hypothetical protein
MKKLSLEISTRILMLAILVVQTGLIIFLLHRLSASKSSLFSVDSGRNYSLLIDAERFPIRASPGQAIRIEVFDTADKIPRPPSRIVINQTEGEEKMALVSESRFRFYFNRQNILHALKVSEKLERLRKTNDWDTVEAVVQNIRSQLHPGGLKVYPSQNAVEILRESKNGSLKVFCAQYCYLTVQSLQALGFYARYLTINGHEVCETWLPQFQKWVCLDPMNDVYYEDASHRKLSGLEVARAADKSVIKTFDGKPAPPVSTDAYKKLWFWLRNDLATHPINIYDLNKYRIRAIQSKEDFNEVQWGDLYTVYPDELYAPPETPTLKS